MFFEGGGTSIIKDHGTWSIGAGNQLTYTPNGSYFPLGSTKQDTIRFTFEDPEGLQMVSSSNYSHTQHQAPNHLSITFNIEGTDTPVAPSTGSTLIIWDGGPLPLMMTIMDYRLILKPTY